MPERHFILGGQKSGKSRSAELHAAGWLSAAPTHRATLIATATAWDDEMRARIARHQVDRAARVPGLRTVEEPLALAQTLAAHSAPDTIVVIDCLTLWLTNLLMPMEGATHDAPSAVAGLCAALRDARGPVVLVGNEIGLGVIPLGSEVRAFVDALGQLNQAVAAACDRVTLMAAGLPLTLKEPA
jgi:adenosylcobinamide kinase / adenosylcobinamide-phosphate guanylyltransferase